MADRFFVTGGSGFIGTRVVANLIDRGFQVTNFDWQAPRPESPAAAIFVQGDILNREALTSALHGSGATRVIHLAAHADISSDWSGFASIYDGTANLLAAIDATSQVRRLTNISTQMVIGPGETPRSVLDFRPYTPYGEAKALAEARLLQWQSDVHWTTVRPAVIWGPHHPSFATEIFRHIAARTYLHPQGKPVIRSYGYVDNTAEQIVALSLASREQTHRRIFYAADTVDNSAIWADAFSIALTGKPARRIAKPLLSSMGKAGDALTALGIRAPINSGRVLRMTTDYPVPLEPMFSIAGLPKISQSQGIVETLHWLRGRS